MDLISLSPPYIPDRWARRMDFQCRLMRRSSVKGKKFITLWGKKSYRDDQRKIIVSKNKRLIEKERCVKQILIRWKKLKILNEYSTLRLYHHVEKGIIEIIYGKWVQLLNFSYHYWRIRNSWTKDRGKLRSMSSYAVLVAIFYIIR